MATVRNRKLSIFDGFFFNPITCCSVVLRHFASLVDGDVRLASDIELRT